MRCLLGEWANPFFATFRSINIRSRYRWGALWGDRGARDLALAASRRGRVSITGVDSWQHYNIALGEETTYLILGRYRDPIGCRVAFNNGDGGSARWSDADVIWFATDTALFRTNSSRRAPARIDPRFHQIPGKPC